MLALSETTNLLARNSFTPIIESNPQRNTSLAYTIERLNESKVYPIVLLNPRNNTNGKNELNVSNFLTQFGESNEYTLGVRLDPSICPQKVLETCRKFRKNKIALIHAGFKDSKGFTDEVKSIPNIDTNIFIDGDCGKMYIDKYSSYDKNVLIRDGLKKRNDYYNFPDSKFFSDLHITYQDQKFMGFGDFLNVGRENPRINYPIEDYSIRLTYFEKNYDNAMYVYHFTSDKDVKPRARGAMFLNALKKMIKAVDSSDSEITNTSAIERFRDLSEEEFYPVEGLIRQLLLTHHIETLSQYNNQNGEVNNELL